MNTQEAKDLICQMVSCMQEIMTSEEFEPYDEAGVMAIDALEKQGTKKPYLKQRGWFDVKMWYCPACNGEIISEWNGNCGNPYCRNCGQAIDWTEVKLRFSGE